MKNKYNPKIDIKFLTHISDEYDNFSSELHIKKVYSGKINAKTFSDKIFERNALAFSFIKKIEKLSFNDIQYITSLFDKAFTLNENGMSEEKVVLPLYFNYSNNVGPDAATSFDQYFSMHYTLLCKKNNNLFYALNNGGSFDDDFLENYWDDTITINGYRGYLYAIIIKKND